MQLIEASKQVESQHNGSQRFSIAIGLLARPENRDTLQQMLANTAWDLTAYRSEADLVALYPRAPNPILVWDLHFNTRSWREVLPLLRRVRPQAVVIFLTDDRSICPEEMLGASAFDVLTHPFARQDLLLTLLFAYSHCRANWPKSTQRREFHPVVCASVKPIGRGR